MSSGVEWKCGCRGEVQRREVADGVVIELAVTEMCARGEHIKYEREATFRRVEERNRQLLARMKGVTND